MTTQETQQLMLDIAMNCHRVGGWIADDYEGKKARIEMFVSQTADYLQKLEQEKVPPLVEATRQSFARSFHGCVADLARPSVNRSAVAEQLMTWGNILSHRAKML